MRTAFLSAIMAATLTLSVQAQQTSKTVTLKVIEPVMFTDISSLGTSWRAGRSGGL